MASMESLSEFVTQRLKRMGVLGGGRGQRLLFLAVMAELKGRDDIPLLLGGKK
jgi:hypothetical protein